MTVSPSKMERSRAHEWRSRLRAAGSVLAVIGAGLWLAGTQGAEAQDTPSCLAATLPGLPDGAQNAPRVWGRGGSAPNILVGRLAVEIQESSKPLVIMYKSDGACRALESLDEGTRTPLSTGSLQYWIRKGGKIVAQPCTLDAAENVLASWGSMAQLADTCNGYPALPADITDTVGPISAFSLLVDKESHEQVISAEAVYYIYGFGPENPHHQVPPWTVPTAIASRGTTSAAGLLLAKAVGIPLSHALYGSVGTPNPAYNGSKGPNDVNTNGAMITFVNAAAAAGNAQATLGFASTETVDAARDKVKSLAFQAKDQEWGYWPDSDQTTSFDKINVREGRYWLWNPHHFYGKLTGPGGAYVDPNAELWIKYITGKEPLPDGKSFLDIQADVGNIPDCAMKVKRDGDLGPLASYQPEVSCGCYFEERVGSLSDACQPCVNQEGPELPNEAADPTCPADAPICRYGYCEVK